MGVPPHHPAPPDVLMQETWTSPSQGNAGGSQTSCLGPTSQQLFHLLLVCHGAVVPSFPSKFPHLFQHLSALRKLEGIARMMQSTTAGVWGR